MVEVDSKLSQYRIGLEMLLEVWPEEGRPVLWHWFNTSSVKEISGDFPRPLSFEEGVVGDGAQEALDKTADEIKSMLI